ncbi:HEAT repeat domain-containing protein [Bradymonas sediminis]|uniref:Uncharacterized protein n=1 Tax=Bradymonas sediminis TaxID=1548548 RepID=A0A2Z4FL58_9DELT|nr:hypothetical protein [Bradymonas sediminis]AWV89438.1 hypothetical protein DN745_08845 [Bradymonas sediminis]TDP76836.1 hypothetical protein DFR33_102473 [Bradymonas sediminis]
MVDYTKAEMLTRRLESSPQRFFESGAWSALLEQYFNGYPVETLRPWLASDDYYVRKSALCIASELGIEAALLVEDILPVFASTDPELVYYALDIAIIGSHLCPEALVEIAHTMDSENEFLRRRAMVLLSTKRPKYLVPALEALQAHEPDGEHAKGLLSLVNASQLSVETARSFILSARPLLRRYGALIAVHKEESRSGLLKLLEASDDGDLRYFANNVRLDGRCGN